MNTRLLGILCIAGSLIAVVGALLFRLRYDSASTGMGVAVGSLMSLGFIAGLIGLIQLNAVGSNPVARAVAFLPIIGLVFASVGQVVSRASSMSSPDSVLSIAFFANPPPSIPKNMFPELTDREKEILDLVAKGENNPAIAEHLRLSTKTVSNYMSNILNKLQVADRAQVIVKARRAGFGE